MNVGFNANEVKKLRLEAALILIAAVVSLAGAVLSFTGSYYSANVFTPSIDAASCITLA